MDTGIQATVVSASRRHVSVATTDGSVLAGRTTTRDLDLVVGDTVYYQCISDEILVETKAARKNTLRRSYFGKEKIIVANLDVLVIMTAPEPLWNPAFIDRAYAAAYAEQIRCILLVNKKDLAEPFSQIAPLLEAYKTLGIEVLPIAAKVDSDFVQLLEALRQGDPNQIALCGVSGVGKSTLLNRLVPAAMHKTQNVSERTGQGKQTTTQAIAFSYTYQRHHAFLIDLPGIQKFGISHLSLEQLMCAFHDFMPFIAGCKFANCTHLVETTCGVREAVTQKLLASSRYESYRHMRKEIKDSQKYD